MAREREGASGRVSWTLETEHEPNCSLPKGFQVLALERVTSTRGWPESLRLGLSKKAAMVSITDFAILGPSQCPAAV